MNFILNQKIKEKKKKKIMTIEAIDVCITEIHGHFFYHCFLPNTWMASQHRFLYCCGTCHAFLLLFPTTLPKTQHFSRPASSLYLIARTVFSLVAYSSRSIKPLTSCIKLQWNTKEWNVKKLAIWILGHSKKHTSKFILYPCYYKNI